MKIALGVVMLCGLAGASKLAHNALAANNHDAAAATDREWATYKARYNKLYDDPQEDAMRRTNWLGIKRQVEEYNSKHGSGAQVVNHLADWTRAERSRLTMDPELLRSRKATNTAEDEVVCQEYLEPLMGKLASLPDEFDWRGSNRVSAVKDQGSCRSCWAFATTGLLEGQLNASIPTIPLSEQQLIDCDQTSRGCNGGWVDEALGSIIKIGGIEAGSTYEYTESKTLCLFDERNPDYRPLEAVLEVQTRCAFSNMDAEAIKALVVHYGPVAVYLHASNSLGQLGSDVYDYTDCDGKDSNHAVLIVGYGRDATKGPYWIVKNSWGLKTGDQGYFKILRGVNKCKIEESAFIALVRTLN